MQFEGNIARISLNEIKAVIDIFLHFSFSKTWDE